MDISQQSVALILFQICQNSSEWSDHSNLNMFELFDLHCEERMA